MLNFSADNANANSQSKTEEHAHPAGEHTELHDAQNALTELKKGNERFTSGKVRTDGQSKADIARLANGQNPHAVVFSCSDSRVPPELVFDQKLGELFTVRSAGEVLSAEEIASIEFAVEKLGTHLIVIMGHTNCGALRAAVDTWHGQSAGSKNLDKLVSDIHARIKAKFDEHHPSKDLKEESWLNAHGAMTELLKKSPVIAKAVDAGTVEIKVGLYHLDSGVVEFE